MINHWLISKVFEKVFEFPLYVKMYYQWVYVKYRSLKTNTKTQTGITKLYPINVSWKINKYIYSRKSQTMKP